jgi:putative acetyltransferase
VLASFVAEQNGRVVGHILFSRTLIEAADESVPFVALAPIVVSPSHQRRGIGSQLVRFGVQWLLTRGERSVLVWGQGSGRSHQSHVSAETSSGLRF